MCQLFETIKVQNNQLQNISYHSERVNKSRYKLFGYSEDWDLENIINIPDIDKLITYRCRLSYSLKVDKIEFIPYIPRLIKKLMIVSDDEIEYAFKYTDRKALDNLKSKYCKNSEEEIIIIKNGLVTDTTFSNIAFFDGSVWITSDSPLLAGTKRAYYIKNKVIKEKRITSNDIQKYEKIRLINAMLDIETGTDIDISNVI